MNHVDRATSGNGHKGRAAGAAEGVVIAVNLEAKLILSGVGFDGVDLEAARRALVFESTAAAHSFPVPLSPWIGTVVCRDAARAYPFQLIRINRSGQEVVCAQTNGLSPELQRCLRIQPGSLRNTHVYATLIRTQNHVASAIRRTAEGLSGRYQGEIQGAGFP